MNNMEKYKKIFNEYFQYNGDIEELEYQEIAEWDSVGHMKIMAAI